MEASPLPRLPHPAGVLLAGHVVHSMMRCSKCGRKLVPGEKGFTIKDSQGEEIYYQSYVCPSGGPGHDTVEGVVVGGEWRRRTG